MSQMGSGFELFQGWAMMSVLMMSPLAIILSWKQRRGTGFLLSSVLGFVVVWALAGIPAIGIFELATNFNSTYATFALCAAAGIYQFSRLHDHAISACMNVSANVGVIHGLQVGWNCLLACGPLMVAAFWVMPSTIAPMIALAALMVLEFTSIYKIAISRIVGLSTGVFALGVLFLAGPIPSFGHLVIHHHS